MVTYYENLTFPMFKCYNRVTDAYQPRKHEKEQPTNLEACEKNLLLRFRCPRDVEKEAYYNITTP